MLLLNSQRAANVSRFISDIATIAQSRCEHCEGYADIESLVCQLPVDHLTFAAHDAFAPYSGPYPMVILIRAFIIGEINGWDETALHEFVVNELRMTTDDVLMHVHADGTITVQLAASIGHGTVPDIKTLSLLRGHCGFVGSYDDAPGLSLNLYRDYVAETDDASIRRDALTILKVLTAEVWGVIDTA